MFPKSVFSAALQELRGEKVQYFKTQMLQEVQRIFAPGSIIAGFGNKLTDALSYKSAGINRCRNFMIGPHVKEGQAEYTKIDGYEEVL